MDETEQDVRDELEQTATETHYSDEMWRLEHIIRKSDGDGLRARWASGHQMLSVRHGKRLPNGALRRTAKSLKVHPSELTARMKFAEKFPTEEELTNVISKFKSWYEIKQKALTDTPQGKKSKPQPTDSERIQSALKDIQTLSYGRRVLTAEDREVLRQIVYLIENMTMDADEEAERAYVDDRLAAEM